MTTMRIDLSRVAEAILRGTVTPKEAKLILQGLGAAAYADWVKRAQQGLRATSRDYVLGLQLQYFPKRAEITLTGVLPNMLENGWDGGDMRAWMLQSKKARTAKDGTKYLAVPFRHGVPGTGGRNVGEAMPPEIYRAARKLVPTVSVATGGGQMRTRWGESLSPDKPRLRQDTRDTLNTLKRPWHTTSIYTGMYKRVTKYPSGAKSTAYQTFRTISTRSRDPRSWVHPGLKAKHFALDVQRELSSMLSRAVWRAMNSNDT